GVEGDKEGGPVADGDVHQQVALGGVIGEQVGDVDDDVKGPGIAVRGGAGEGDQAVDDRDDAGAHILGEDTRGVVRRPRGVAEVDLHIDEGGETVGTAAVVLPEAERVDDAGGRELRASVDLLITHGLDAEGANVEGEAVVEVPLGGGV